jgi:hypothetical protein
MTQRAAVDPDFAKTATQGYQGFLGVHNSWKQKMKLK